MAQNFWTAIYAFTAAFLLTIIISLMTKKLKSDEDLKGLVYSLTPKIVEEGIVWYRRPAPLAIIVGVVAIILSLLFW